MSEALPKSVVFLLRRDWLNGLSVRESAADRDVPTSTVKFYHKRWNEEAGVGGRHGERALANTRRKSTSIGAGGLNESADLCELIAAPKGVRQLRYWNGADE